MSITAKVSVDPKIWFGSLEPASIRSGLSELRHSLIFLTDQENFVELCSRSLERMDNPTSREILRNYTANIPVSFVQPFTYVDLEPDVGRLPGNCFDIVAVTKDFENLVTERTRPASSGEMREVTFTRIFSPMAAYSKNIRAIDRFAAKNLVERTSSDWILKRLMQETKADIEIYTVPPAWAPNKVWENGKPDPKLELIVPFLRSKILSLKTAVKTYQGSIHVHLFEKLRHNRRINFRFDESSITLNLEKGLDTFGNEKFSEDMYFYGRDNINNFECRIKSIVAGQKLDTIVV